MAGTIVAPPGSPPPARHAAGLTRTFGALRYPGFVYIWVGILFTSAGVWMEQVALSWLIYEMTDSPFLLGALNGVRSLPFLFFSPVGGVVADRFDRRFLMMASQYVLLGLYAALLALLFFDLLQVWHLFAFTVLGSTAWCFNQPVRQSLVPQLVPREHLVNAVALQSFGFNIMRIAGPALGGVLMATVGGRGTFLLVTVAWVGVIAVSYLVPFPPRPPRVERTNMWDDLVAGLQYIRGDRVVLGLMLIALVPMVLGMTFQTLMPVFARDVFEMDARGLGELMSATGVGAVVSALAVASLGGYRGKGMILVGSGIALGLALVAFAMSTSYLLSLGLLVIVGAFSMASVTLASGMIQMATPQQYMGRVMSIYMLDRGLMPLGSFAAGALAEAFTGPLAMAVMGACCAFFVALSGAAMPHLRRLA